MRPGTLPQPLPALAGMQCSRGEIGAAEGSSSSNEERGVGAGIHMGATTSALSSSRARTFGLTLGWPGSWQPPYLVQKVRIVLSAQYRLEIVSLILILPFHCLSLPHADGCTRACGLVSELSVA